MIFNKLKRNDFALTEFLLALSIVVIMGIAAYPFYSDAKTSNEVDITSSNIFSLQKNVRLLYSGQETYTNLGIDLIAGMDLIPDGFKKTETSSEYLNAWGGSMNVGFYTSSKIFYIELTDIPQKACNQLITQVSKSFVDISGTEGIFVKGGMNEGGVITGSKNTVDINLLNTACSSSSNNLTFLSK